MIKSVLASTVTLLALVVVVGCIVIMCQPAESSATLTCQSASNHEGALLPSEKVATFKNSDGSFETVVCTLGE